MIGDVLGYLDYSTCAIIALVLFTTVFVSVAIQLLFMRPEDSRQRSRIPIEDGVRRNIHV